jgi:ribosome recycling factor
MDEPFIADLKQRMQKALHFIMEDLASIRTGRATPALVENVVISSYENTQHLRLKEMATITTDGARMIIIAPFDPTVTPDIERGIQVANLGYTAAPDGNILRISIPPLTADRRDEYIKLAHQKVESGRVMIRQVRHEVMNDLKQQFDAKEVAEDDKKRLEKEIQIITDEIMVEIDALKKKKEEELLQV